MAARTSAGQVAYLAGDQEGTQTLAVDSATLAVASREFQVANAGPTEYRVTGGGEIIWADGIDGSSLVDAKFVGSDQSPYVPGSGVPGFIQDKIDAQQESEMRRYSAVINDSDSGFTDLRIVTNLEGAVSYFEGMMNTFGVPGEVVVAP